MTQHPAFDLIQEAHVSEVNSQAYYYHHKKTGAKILSLANDDENKVFGITFRTPPEDSTGIAHIMEHSVLCGSRKYPVKEPFVELLKSSLYTFLNAFTYPDKTCYPVASTNLQDFYNLVDVYLDAVLHPRITPEILQQEGWHYELENADDPIIYKGVVFNEMKGANASPYRAISRASTSSIFPDNTYRVDSGGDPANIPDLTYEQFKTFHETYYHPSNAYIYFYGDDNPARRLELIDEYLQEFDEKPVDSRVALQARFDEHRRVNTRYYSGDNEGGGNKGVVTINWLIGDTLNRTERLRLRLLDQVLLGNPAAPLWKALIDSGLGEDLSATGLAMSLRQLAFSTGLMGIDPADADKVEKVVFDTLEALVKNGIPADTLEAAINTIEFRLRENNTGSYPRGLALMLRALSTWLHDSDPIEPLGFENALKTIKEDLAGNKQLLEEMIKTHLLSNMHRTTVVLTPDAAIAEEKEAAEKARLEKIQSGMTPADLQQIISDTQTLKDAQKQPDAPEDLAKIPRLTLDDLEKKHKPLPLEVFRHGETEILYHDLFTSGVLYLDIGFNLKNVPQRLLPYLRLFGRAMLEMGTREENFVSLSERIGKHTGGISQSAVTSLTRDGQDINAWLFFWGKSMVGQTGKLLALFRDIFLLPNLTDQERFRQLVLDAKSSKENSLGAAGHALVQSRLKASFSPSGWLGELTGGVNYLKFLRKLSEKVDSDWASVQADLEDFYETLFHRGGMICNVTLDEENWRVVKPQLEEFLEEMPRKNIELQTWKPKLRNGFEGLAVPARINYVGKAANIYDSGYQYHGSIAVIQKFLRTNWLWNRVRVQGGAYGAFCNFSKRSGIFSYVSYRDPNLFDTLKNYDAAGEYLRKAAPEGEEMVKSIIGAIGDVSPYQLPDEKGYTSMVRYLFDERDEEIQQLRDEILNTRAEHFREFADMLDHVRDNGLVIVAGSEEALRKANETQGDAEWLKIKNLM